MRASVLSQHFRYGSLRVFVQILEHVIAFYPYFIKK